MIQKNQKTVFKEYKVSTYKISTMNFIKNNFSNENCIKLKGIVLRMIKDHNKIFVKLKGIALKGIALKIIALKIIKDN